MKKKKKKDKLAAKGKGKGALSKVTHKPTGAYP